MTTTGAADMSGTSTTSPADQQGKPASSKKSPDSLAVDDDQHDIATPSTDERAAIKSTEHEAIQSSDEPDHGQSQATIVFVGGGSGGHIAPGLAIRERLEETSSVPANSTFGDATQPPKQKPISCRFICSTRAIDSRMLDAVSADYATIDAAPLLMRPAGLLRFLRQFPKATRQARELFQQWQPDCVLALGGFIAAPAVRAAHQLGVPVVLLNLDDPPGKANRLMARWVSEVWSAVDLPGHPDFASRIVGMPIRRAALADRSPQSCRRALGLNPERLTLLITGASQGASSVNDLLARMARRHSRWLEGWQVLHLAGSSAATTVRERYEQARIPAVVVDFLDEMGLAWGAADLAISRSGANSVAEAAANEVPTIFLPYPHHRDQHQRHNAEPLGKLGGAVILDDFIDAERNIVQHGQIIKSLLTESHRRHTMKQALCDRRVIDAASVVADHLRAMVRL